MPIDQQTRVQTGRAFHNDVTLALLHRLESITSHLIDGEKALTDDGWECVKSVFGFYNSLLVGDDYERSVARMGLPAVHEESEKDRRLRRRIKILDREFGPQAAEVQLCQAEIEPGSTVYGNWCIVEKGHADNVPHVGANGKMRDNR
jgi:hypothetical protein